MGQASMIIGVALRSGGPQAGCSSVGVTSAPVLDGGGPTTQGVQVKASLSNTDIIYIGGTAAVTADTAATGGYPLSPGDELVLPCDNVNEVYAISGTASQKLHWLAL